jgi:hypothetical protein
MSVLLSGCRIQDAGYRRQGKDHLLHPEAFAPKMCSVRVPEVEAGGWPPAESGTVTSDLISSSENKKL